MTPPPLLLPLHASSPTSAPPTNRPPHHHILREVLPQDVCLLTFNQEGSSANTLDPHSLRALASELDWILGQPLIRGLIITSSKPRIFVAGADISLFQSASPEEIDDLIVLGQSVFQRLADLPIPTVAAIHGACLGGGLELALACSYRIASDDPSTRIGLPETRLGILPAWGGTTRLPRLIGLPSALRLILTGVPVPAHEARRLHILDALVPRAHLISHALDFISKPPHPKPRRHLANTWPFPHLIHHFQSRILKSKSHGNYPALDSALRVACRGILSPEKTSLSLEREAVNLLAQSPEAKNLIRIFFLQERAKKSPPAPTASSIANTAVIGGGIMGSAIATYFASHGHRTILADVSNQALAAALTRIAHSLARSSGILSARDARDTLDLISPSSSPVPLTHTDLVVEAAIESLDIKKRIFADLAARCPENTILATNTSSLSVTALAEAPDVTAPHRVIGLHFFNPVAKMKLVEVVVTPHTSPEVLARTLSFVRSIGKLPVVVHDAPGFVVNRILVPYLTAAGSLFDGGLPPESIDRAMLSFGMPMGPLRLLDEVGNDVALHVAMSLASAFGDARMAVPNILTRMVDAGLLGKKSGAGFYSYSKAKTPRPNPAALSLRRTSSSPVLPTTSETILRLVVPMLVEASRCLGEGVVTDPRDIDFAMVMGTGFAPFRGGPLRYADDLGSDLILTKCQDFGIDPDPLLRDLAASHRTFY